MSIERAPSQGGTSFSWEREEGPSPIYEAANSAGMPDVNSAGSRNAHQFTTIQKRISILKELEAWRPDRSAALSKRERLA